jgi:uncharacterized membrane protein YphA (DoxX/SURF4 family)
MIKPADVLSLVGRLLVGGVLIYAGFSKALAPAAEFAAALANYHLFPSAWLTPMAWAVPWLEIWAGLFLVAGLYTRWAAGCSAALFAVFLTVLTLAKLRHIDLTSCGCFGAETLSPAITFKMDATLLVIALLVLFSNPQSRAFTLDSKTD